MGKRNDQGFDKDYRTYYREIYRFIYHHVMNKEEAENLTQDTFLKYLENYPDGVDEAGKKQLLVTMAKNFCISYFRHREVEDRHRLKVAEYLEELAREEYNEEEDLSRVLDASYEHLSREEYQIIRLKLQGKNYEEISEALGLSHSQVQRHVQKAYDTIRNLARRILCFFLSL